MIVAFCVLTILILASGLTGLLRHYALRRQLLDVPNDRSSHTVPTPRGGGLAIVITFLLSFSVLWLLGIVSVGIFIGAVGSGLCVAAVGFLDDHGHIAARWRLLGHFASAMWALAWLKGAPILVLGGYQFDLGWLGEVLAVFYLVWLLNLYNFMDGIDGIAAVEAITVCVVVCGLYIFSGRLDQAWAPMLLAGAVGGFLFWNFPPAKIFMGDAGSGFLGFILGVLSLEGARSDPRFLWVWLIMLGVFIVDATFTLFRRLLRGEKVYEAHRSHAYQYAARIYGKHLPVTMAVALINTCWLAPIAFCFTWLDLNGLMAVTLAYSPLVIMAIRHHAGEAELKP